MGKSQHTCPTASGWLLFVTAAEKAGNIAVDELTQGGHAQQAGIAVGDVLLAVTARAQVS